MQANYSLSGGGGDIEASTTAAQDVETGTASGGVRCSSEIKQLAGCILKRTLWYKLLVTMCIHLSDIMAAVVFATVLSGVPIDVVEIIAAVAFTVSMLTWGSGVVFVPPTYALYARLLQPSCRDYFWRTPMVHQAEKAYNIIRDSNHMLGWRVLTGRISNGNGVPATSSGSSGSSGHTWTKIRFSWGGNVRLLMAGTTIYIVAAFVAVQVGDKKEGYATSDQSVRTNSSIVTWLPSWRLIAVTAVPVWVGACLLIQGLSLLLAYWQLTRQGLAHDRDLFCLKSPRTPQGSLGGVFRPLLSLLTSCMLIVFGFVCLILAPLLAPWLHIRRSEGMLLEYWSWQHWMLLTERLPTSTVTNPQVQELPSGNSSCIDSEEWTFWLDHFEQVVISNAATGFCMISMYHILEWLRTGLFITVAIIPSMVATENTMQAMQSKVAIVVLTAAVPIIKAIRDKWGLLERGIQHWGYAGACIKQLQYTLDEISKGQGRAEQGSHQRAALTCMHIRDALKQVKEEVAESPTDGDCRAQLLIQMQATLKVIDEAVGPDLFKRSFL